MKKCGKCKIDKELQEFSSNKRSPDSLCLWCKDCVREYGKQYRQSKKEKIRTLNKIYRENNKEAIKRKKADYYSHNKEKIKKEQKEFRLNNKEKIKEQRRMDRKRNENKIRQRKIAYYKRNKNKIVKRSVENRKKMRAKDISFRILDNCRSRIRMHIKRLIKCGVSKLERTSELLGCSGPELKVYLESKFKPGMTWENYGMYGWHIDHVKPCASFNDFNKIETQKECFNYKNLQPLWAKENLLKSDKLNGVAGTL